MFKIVSVVFILTFKTSPIMSLEGLQFVVGCPWLSNGRVCDAYFSTQEKGITVEMTKIVNDKKNKEPEIWILEFDATQGKHVSLVDNVEDPPTANKDILVFAFNSDKKFRIFVLSRKSSFLSESASIGLIPKESCSSSYYTMTAKGNPFIAVFSFEAEKTNVKVEFPNEGNYSVGCFADVNCAPESTVSFELLAYRGWFLTITDELANLRGAHVTSDVPVFVISGSVLGWSRIKESTELATSSILPSTSWGRKYIVPLLIPNEAVFTFLSTKTPLEITLSEENELSRVYLHESPQVRSYRHGMPKNTLLVRADEPFGMFKIFSSRMIGSDGFSGDVSILVMIPVELWKTSFLYDNIAAPPEFQGLLYLVIQGNPDKVEITPRVKREKISTTTILGVSYSVEQINPTNESLKFSGARMILYILYSPEASNQISLGAYPYDFDVQELYVDGSVSAYDDNTADVPEKESGFLFILLILLGAIVVLGAVAFLHLKKKSDEGKTHKHENGEVDEFVDEPAAAAESENVFIEA